VSSLHFTATIQIIGVNPYVLVTAKKARVLKKEWKKPMPVLVQINGQPNPPWRINMMPKGNGDFYLYLHGNVRKASRTGAGDTVSVFVTFDTAYRDGPMHPMPEWFANSLEGNPLAKTNWDKLIPSRKKEILRYLAGLKSPEAKERNLKKALVVLSGKPERFMARDWYKGK
jgi:hypothetical protein